MRSEVQVFIWFSVHRSLDRAIWLVGEDDIQEEKGAVLFQLYCELDVLVDAVEMFMKGCDGHAHPWAWLYKYYQHTSSKGVESV